MDRVELKEVFFPGQYDYWTPDSLFYATAWKAPSGKGYTLHIAYKRYPFDSVAVRELPDIHAAEIAAAAFITSRRNRAAREKED